MKLFIVHENQNTKPSAEEGVLNANSVLGNDEVKYLSLNINNVLDYVDYEKRFEILNKFLEKIRYNGLIIISGVDLLRLSRDIFYGRIATKTSNEIINQVSSLDVFSNVTDFLVQRNFLIQNVKLDSINYYIEAQRIQDD